MPLLYIFVCKEIRSVVYLLHFTTDYLVFITSSLSFSVTCIIVILPKSYKPWKRISFGLCYNDCSHWFQTLRCCTKDFMYILFPYITWAPTLSKAASPIFFKTLSHFGPVCRVKIRSRKIGFMYSALTSLERPRS